MKTISQSFIFAGIVLALVAGVFAFSAITADAQTTCGSCGESSTPSTPTGGGGDNSNPPSCDISASISVAEHGEGYTISWIGTPANATFEVNDYPVDAVDSFDYTFTAENQSRFVFTGENGDGNCVDEVIVKKKPEVEKKCELEITKSVDKHSATPGEELTYEIKVENTGTADCTGGGVKIEDVLDSNFEYVSNTYTSNLTEGYGSAPVYTASTRTIRFNGNTLNPGESGTIVLFGKVATPHTCGDYVVKNQAKATAKELNNFTTWVYSNVVKTNVDYDCEVPVPVCESFTDEPATLPFGGGTSILDWDLINVATAAIDQGVGDVTIGNPAVDKTMSGTKTVDVTETTTFTLTAFNVAGQKVTCQTTVEVEDPNPAPKCLAFLGNGQSSVTITEGEAINLTWDTLNATQILINNAVGDVTDIVEKTKSVAPIADTIYSLIVIGEEGTVNDTSCKVPVTVHPKVIPGDPSITIDKNDTDDKDDTQEVEVGGTANFTIVVTNNGDEDLVNVVVTDPIEPTCGKTIGALAIGASDSYTCSTTNVFAAFTNTAFVTGESAVDGKTVEANDPTDVTVKPDVEPGVCQSFAAEPSALPVGGGNVVLDWVVLNSTNVSISNGVGTDLGLTGPSAPITVTEGTTFVLTATGEDGEPVECEAPVVVADPGVFSCEANVSFSASDTSLTRGQSSTLAWDVTDADSVSISVINATAFTGSQTVTPSVDTTYTLTAEKSGYNPISCPVSITVSSGGGGSSSPRCELDISATRINAGDEIELTWESRLATELTLTDSFGNVLVTTEDKLSDDKEDLFDGSLILNPTRNTTYTLVVERGSRDRECEVDVEMDDDIVVLETRSQAPLVSGISLTQVPYTGFEAGPVMTVLFYMLLITWALYITYVLVMPKARLAMVPVTNTGVKSNEDLMQNAEQIRPDVFAAISAAPVVEAPANLPVAATPAAMPVVADIPETNTIENQAHALQALISSDAARTIAGMTNESNQAEVLAKIVNDAKGQFPLEDGWVVINQSRLAQITDVAATTVSPTPTGAGSLAEAIVTGNVVAAYDLVGARPMIALADAAADLDAVYRIRKGADATISDMLASETANFSEEQIAGMIAALTGALDGTYTDEASAVKMAIMKAVQIAG